MEGVEGLQVNGLTGFSGLFGIIRSVSVCLPLPAVPLLVLWFILAQIKKELGYWFLLNKKELFK